MSTGVAVVVLDIEGTTSPLTAVHDRLFPYARAHLPAWLRENWDTPPGQEVVEGVREALGNPDADPGEVEATLLSWIDQDVKASPLKTAQGHIWRAGYAEGTLRGEVYPDVPKALESWRAAGIPVHIYSSGSVRAQRDWFAHTDHGDLSSHLAGHWDLTTAGPKREPASYHRIAEALGVPAGQVLFLSDVAAELDAARAAGWQVVGVHRPGEAGPGDGGAGHRWVAEFGELELAGG
ncbi:enolase-phosphatase E1 [Crossiella equi]|uniref:Enolase-phosphatase E1 n=1 Tax=Crossiella equi TaxID=130796 RepID=A0ABS5ACT2_9PSEU|nr:acireductone synthase [Crossiella equi]MBP2474077.1 enolase-phosphatase E1 [Crossiella equi]